MEMSRLFLCFNEIVMRAGGTRVARRFNSVASLTNQFLFLFVFLTQVLTKNMNPADIAIPIVGYFYAISLFLIRGVYVLGI